MREGYYGTQTARPDGRRPEGRPRSVTRRGGRDTAASYRPALLSGPLDLSPIPAIETALRFEFLPEHGLRPRRFLDELYRIVSRHPGYDAAREPDLSPATPWWRVAAHLLVTFRRLTDPRFDLRIIHEEEKGVSLQLHYAIETRYDYYLADVSFLPHLRQHHRPLHDLTVRFLATLLRRTAIGDWREYLEQGIYHDWLSETDDEERSDRDRRALLSYYGKKEGLPSRYHDLLHPERIETPEELVRRLDRLRPGGYPAPLRSLMETMRDTLPLLDAADISLAALAYPLTQEELDEQGSYPVQPDEYIALVWNDHRTLTVDDIQQNHHYHIESTGNEYGLWPLGGVLICRPDEPYEIRKRDLDAFNGILESLCRFTEGGQEIKKLFGVTD